MKRNTGQIDFEGIAFFATIEDAVLEELSEIATLYELAPGETLFHQGDSAHSIFIVQKGGVQLIEHTLEGKAVNLKVYGRGDLFGMLAISGSFPHPASIVAAQESEIIGLRGTEVRKILMKHPSLALIFIDLLVDHVHHAHQRIRHLATERVERRLARALLHFYDKFGSREDGVWRIQAVLTQQDLAEFIGTTVETINRTLRIWEDENLLRRSRMRIDLLDLEGLRRYAEGQPRDEMSYLLD